MKAARQIISTVGGSYPAGMGRPVTIDATIQVTSTSYVNTHIYKRYYAPNEWGQTDGFDDSGEAVFPLVAGEFREENGEWVGYATLQTIATLDQRLTKSGYMLVGCAGFIDDRITSLSIGDQVIP